LGIPKSVTIGQQRLKLGVSNTYTAEIIGIPSIARNHLDGAHARQLASTENAGRQNDGPETPIRVKLS